MNEHQFGEQHIPLIPVIGAKSYIQLKQHERLEMQMIMDSKEIGTWVLTEDKDSIQVWDGEEWFEVPKRLPYVLGILPHNMTERFNSDEIEHLKEVVQDYVEEEERMMLRRLLTESQADER